MDVLILQSYRPGPRPGWIDTCLHSVSHWAARRGYARLMLGDELLEIVPAAVRERCGPVVCPVTDIGRVLWARRLLAQGWRRVLWLDADLLVFDPERFSVDLGPTLRLCREVWVEEPVEDVHEARLNVNNCVMGIGARAPLAGYLAWADRRLRNPDLMVDELAVGTPVFTAAHARRPLPLVETVATVNHVLMDELLEGAGGAVRAHAAQLTGPTYAAHFTHSFGREAPHRALVTQDRFERAVERVLQTRGAVLQA